MCTHVLLAGRQAVRRVELRSCLYSLSSTDEAAVNTFTNTIQQDNHLQSVGYFKFVLSCFQSINQSVNQVQPVSNSLRELSHKCQVVGQSYSYGGQIANIVILGAARKADWTPRTTCVKPQICLITQYYYYYCY